MNPLEPFLLLVLLISLFAAVTPAAHHHRHLPAAAAAATTNYEACAATRYLSVCNATLSSPSIPPHLTATKLIVATASAAEVELSAATSLVRSILNSSLADANRTNAALNCLEFLSLSNRRLTAASRAPSPSLHDARAWVSAALLYQYDCWSALNHVNTDDDADLTAAESLVSHVGNVTSNALSMIAALQRYGEDTSLWAPPQTERDGYWGSGNSSAADSYGSGSVFPSAAEANATVCRAGCGYATVQAAVEAAPSNGAARFVIHIQEGVYVERVKVPFEKTNVVFVGDGMGKTVITGSMNVTVGASTYNTATVGVSGDGFMARDLTIENTAGPDAHQAVAFLSDSDHSVLELVEFSGHQDTLYAHSLRQYYRNCRISGTVDFIFGNSAAVFDNCTILFVPRQLNPEKGETNTVSAHGRTDPAQSTGFVFRQCTVNGSEDYLALYKAKPAVHKGYLGRPWKEYSRTVFLECVLGEVVRPEGWLPWSGDFALATLFYGEFGSEGAGSVASKRVSWSSQIPAEHVGIYSPENFIQGGKWIPSYQQ